MDNDSDIRDGEEAEDIQENSVPPPASPTSTLTPGLLQPLHQRGGGGRRQTRMIRPAGMLLDEPPPSAATSNHEEPDILPDIRSRRSRAPRAPRRPDDNIWAAALAGLH